MTGIRRLFLFCWLMLLLPTVATAGDSVMTTCPEVKLEVERLTDLNIPRAGHELFCVNGEMVVAGGHTDGFVPTSTAEYYQGGEWHTIPMTSPFFSAFFTSVLLDSRPIRIGERTPGKRTRLRTGRMGTVDGVSTLMIS